MNERAEAKQSVLYSYFCEKITGEGISRKELDAIKNFPIGHQSVEDFVNVNVRLGSFEWRKDLLVNATQRLTVKLTKKEEDKLQEKAKDAGLTTNELVSKLILNVINN